MTTKNKLKILMCSEASFLKSGFGTYAKEILSRLHKTDKYIVAEFASYGVVNDPRDQSIDWIYYANAVKEGDPRHAEYSSRSDNQFGRWRFEKVLLDFKPDVVIDVRDYWMTAYQYCSPLRKYFHWILMPTVDSEPQQEDWIDMFLSANAIFTYSDWGADVLKRQSSGQINYIDTTSPGVDLDTFKIIQDKASLKNSFGLPSDSVIIGSVMRNQKRKLIPELFSSFRKILDRLDIEDPELSKKTYLYLHTSFPDAGWDIPELLKDNRVSNKVLFTYVCKKCKNVTCEVFKGPQNICKKCLNKSAVFPTVADGVSPEDLAKIFNLFDAYVQYSICEGFGMPQVEAGACGIPIFSVDYSAMCDVIQKLNATPIKIQTTFKELETKALRVYPDNNDLIEKLLAFIKLPTSIRNQKRFEVRKLTEKHYCWNTIATKWEKYLDQLDSSGYRANWSAAATYMSPIEENIPEINNDKIFDSTVTLCTNYLKDIDNMSSMTYLNMLNDADYSFISMGVQTRPFSFKDIVEHTKITINNNNQAESVRSNNVTFNEDFIIYAKMKAQQS